MATGRWVGVILNITARHRPSAIRVVQRLRRGEALGERFLDHHIEVRD
jgi:hypothetical protein